MALVACYVVHNEADVIAESLRSVKAYVDRYVIVDSVFASNPIEATHSTDDTRKVCERICAPLPLTYIESDRKLRQDQARNRYLDEVRFGEWVLNLDGDEVLYGDHAEVIEVLSWLQHGSDNAWVINVPILSAFVMVHGYAADVTPEMYATAPISHTRGYAPRVFQKVPGVEYRQVVAPNGIVDNQGAWLGEDTIGSRGLRDDRLAIINHHVRQGYDGYLSDAIWEMANDRQAISETETEREVALRRYVAGRQYTAIDTIP
jgi:glycosyltransferase involved in cell wall biosynthesis